MYESFYNLKAEPFRLSPDHRFCFSHKSYAKAKAYMQYAIHRAEGFVMVTGKPGTGKTTLVNDLVEGLATSKIVVATIVSTQLEADDLLRLVSCNFGLDIDAPNKAAVLQGLSVRLKRHYEEGTRALLIIDEAQDLSTSALEELRLLTNLQMNNQPLLQIFLVGQENLRDLVQKPSMEQVHQRLVAACHLQSLSEADTRAYIQHRLSRVGWKDDPSIDEAVYPLVFQFSKGVPRRINLICSRFLLLGSIEEKHRIKASDVRTVLGELQHEQLAPVGFSSEFSPLDDDEPELIEEPIASETEVDKPAKTLQEATTADAFDDDAASLVSAPAAEAPAEVTAKAAHEEPVSVVEIDASEPVVSEAAAKVTPVKESRPVSLDASRTQETNASVELSDEDVIQHNYFSLSDAIDGVSEPLPLKPSSQSESTRYGYGDRFAKAQKARNQSTGGTQYYNEYQGGGRAARTKPRRGFLVSLLLFLLVLSVVLTGVYLVRPQPLQPEIALVEERVTAWIGKAKSMIGGGSEAVPPAAGYSDDNREPAQERGFQKQKQHLPAEPVGLKSTEVPQKASSADGGQLSSAPTVELPVATQTVDGDAVRAEPAARPDNAVLRKKAPTAAVSESDSKQRLALEATSALPSDVNALFGEEQHHLVAVTSARLAQQNSGNRNGTSTDNGGFFARLAQSRAAGRSEQSDKSVNLADRDVSTEASSR